MKSFTVRVTGSRINSVSVYNLMGVRVTELNGIEGNEAVLDLDAHPAGVYIYKVSSEGGDTAGKIYKQ